MSIELVSALMGGAFVLLLLLGLPLAFAAASTAVGFALLLYGLPGLTLVVSRVFTLLGNNVLVSVPLFVFMACLLDRAGIADDIFRVVAAWASRVPGGLAVAVIITSTLMAAMALDSEGFNGLALGAWGGVQATCAGLAIGAGGVIRDTVSALATRGALGEVLTNPATGYSFVYHLEICLLFTTLIAIGPLVRTRRRATPASTSRYGLPGLPGQARTRS
jgi:BCD family chlorophyll transporter-like MFS transporter